MVAKGPKGPTDNSLSQNQEFRHCNSEKARIGKKGQVKCIDSLTGQRYNRTKSSKNARAAVKCLRQRVVAVFIMVSPAHIEMIPCYYCQTIYGARD